ncbi:MAG TPA: NAD(P)/FAD-dependent oxidoreductase [Anaerolineales bacterium]|nr:NAD(P)/FAD-dependent oxidoreductase [Anaerolineales bacterium]
MYDLIIIGGGPAGLTAAIYAIRKRLNVLLVSEDLGGKTNFHLQLPETEQYQVIRGLEVVDKFRSELEYLKFARHMEPVDRVTRDGGHFIVHTDEGGELTTKAVIVATGARVQFLEVPGEHEFMGRGLSYSAMSYAPLFLDKKAVVVGEGDLALRSAAELAIIAEHVALVGPNMDQMHTPMGAKLKATKNVTIYDEFRVTSLHGNGYVNKVTVRGPDGEELQIEADGVFVEKALRPNSEIVADLVELDEEGHILIDTAGRTIIPGLFAAGDVATTTEQVLVAVGEGAKAALSAYEYLLPTL